LYAERIAFGDPLGNRCELAFLAEFDQGEKVLLHSDGGEHRFSVSPVWENVLAVSAFLQNCPQNFLSILIFTW
jgi:hypothetical protein